MKKDEFERALRAVDGAVQSKSGGEASFDTITFLGSAVGACDGALSVLYPLKTGVQGRIKAKELLALVSKMRGEEIKVSQSKTDLTISGGTTELTMPFVEGQDLFDFLGDFDPEKMDWKPLPAELLTGLGLCSSSVAKDPGFLSLCGVGVSGADVFSSDNRRISWYFLPDDEGMGPLVMPVGAVKELVALGGITEYDHDGGWCHFRAENGAVLSTRLLGNESFPFEKIREVFPKDEDVAQLGTFVMPKGVDDAIQRAAIFSFEDGRGNPFVQIERKGDTIEVSGRSVAGRIRDRIALAEGEDFPEGVLMSVNPEYLKGVLGITRTFAFDPRTYKIVFLSETFWHLVAGVRVPEKEAEQEPGPEPTPEEDTAPSKDPEPVEQDDKKPARKARKPRAKG